MLKSYVHTHTERGLELPAVFRAAAAWPAATRAQEERDQGQH
jgi:hypothetical protein